MKATIDTADLLLQSAYKDLGFEDGVLLEATEKPTSSSESAWVDKGDWLTLAKTIDAEKIFFVENNPVIIFAKREETGSAVWREVFNLAWCMARPPILFLAQPGLLSVLDLTHSPASQHDDTTTREKRLLASVTRATDVQISLQKYHRYQIESGKIFEDENRFAFNDRADRALIRDLKLVREALVKKNLPIEHVHSLIGRSIFIRYLEDRGVITSDYYQKVADQNKSWTGLVNEAIKNANNTDNKKSIYVHTLSNKEFIYTLYKQLHIDFNGDMFPLDTNEENKVTEDHLRLLQSLLVGKIPQETSGQSQLFFFAYDFKIIPIELISSIYEEFYSLEKGKSSNQGSFYTPAALVEYVVSQTITEEILDKKPRILDPACGSGIFLVESFRRIVRHLVRKNEGQRLSADQLRNILKEQITGIEINPEAVRVAAFSLYLALLHYQRPSDILKSPKLPNLTYKSENKFASSNHHFDILLPFNAFELEKNISNPNVIKRFASGSFDIIVGNPPWGGSRGKDTQTVIEIKKATEWCEKINRSVGNCELSQAFIHLSNDFLREGGRIGLLVSTAVFFNRNDKSLEFRHQWLKETSLSQVVNFAAVRDVFFSKGREAKAIAPFASVVFDKIPPQRNKRFQYWSAKKTAFIGGTQSVLLSLPDLKTLRQESVLHDDELWKIYWWGGHHDEALIHALRLETSLQGQLNNGNKLDSVIGLGFSEASKDKPSEWLCNYSELPKSAFERYGTLKRDKFIDPPSDGVERDRNPEPPNRNPKRSKLPILYEGLRLLIRRGIQQKNRADGKLIARLESDSFCFRNFIYGVPINDDMQSNAKVLLGIIWSSLIRYYLWMTSGSWVGWHYELRKSDILNLPIRLPADRKVRQRIEEIVDKLRNLNQKNLLNQKDVIPENSLYVKQLETKLDETIFDLYELTFDERDLVNDMCSLGIDLFYHGRESDAVKPVIIDLDNINLGRINDLSIDREQSGISGYLRSFLDIWNRELEPNGEFRWRVLLPSERQTLLAIIFETEDRKDPLPDPIESNDVKLNEILSRLNDTTRVKISRRIYIDGLVRTVSENDIIIIKRNERRLWTRTAAREDAEATLLQAINRQNLAIARQKS
ncbi:SAM-dependent methyltransferase [bacterium]|nr:SAM-dependent methyltransferase [bacterium]